jgi:hypothetical protein
MCGESVQVNPEHGLGSLTVFLLVFAPQLNEFGRDFLLWVEFPVARRTPGKISGTVSFRVTIKAILQYNSIACKVLTELVLAYANRH